VGTHSVHQMTTAVILLFSGAPNIHLLKLRSNIYDKRVEHSDTAVIRQSGLSTTLACTGKTKIRPGCILRLLGS
jgi:hypothetical protein